MSKTINDYPDNSQNSSAITTKELLDTIENKDEESFLFYLNNKSDLEISKTIINSVIKNTWTSVYSKLIEKLSTSEMLFFIDEHSKEHHLEVLFNSENFYYQQIKQIHGDLLLSELQQLQLKKILKSSNPEQNKLNMTIPYIIKGNRNSLIEEHIQHIFENNLKQISPIQILKLAEENWINPFITLEAISKYKKEKFNAYETKTWRLLVEHIEKNNNTWDAMIAKVSITQRFFPDYLELITLIEHLPNPSNLNVNIVKEHSFIYEKMLLDFDNCDHTTHVFLTNKIREHKKHSISGNEVVELLFIIEKEIKNNDVFQLLISEEKIKKLKEIQIKKTLLNTPKLKPMIRF